MFKTNSNRKNKLYVADNKRHFDSKTNLVVIKPKPLEPSLSEPLREDLETLEEKPISVKDLIQRKEEEINEINKRQINMETIPEDVKKTLNKLLFVSRYKKL